jgi:hypothetical protein
MTGIAHHTTGMALKLRRDLVNFVGQFLAVTHRVVSFVGIRYLRHFDSPLKVKVHERADPGLE